MENILNEPKYGWSHLQIEDYGVPLSYIEDIPQKMLEMAAEYQAKQFACTCFDCEGYDITIVLSSHEVNILEHKDEVPGFIHSKMDADDFCRQVVKDIETYLDSWVRTYFYEEEKTESKGYRHKIQDMLKTCKGSQSANIG